MFRSNHWRAEVVTARARPAGMAPIHRRPGPGDEKGIDMGALTPQSAWRSPVRAFWLTCGGLALTMGLIGVFVPLLPTTAFLILSAYCFGKSSQRLHDWLINHAVFGPPICDWRAHGAIARRAKYMSAIAMAALLFLSWMFSVPLYVLALQAVILSAVALFLFTRPEPPADAQ